MLFFFSFSSSSGKLFPFSLLLLVANSLFFPLTPGFVVRNVVYIVATYIDCRT